MVTLRGLLSACHPLPTAAVTAFVTAVTIATGRSPVGCLLVALAVLTGQLSVGWCNDAVDASLDRAAGRRGKPIAAGLASRRAVGTAAGSAFAACVPLSLASGAAAGTVHLVGVAAAWAYDLGVKRTPLSWLPYVIGFGSLPAFVTLGLPGAPPPAVWGVAAAALLGVSAHFANVLPDIDADLRAGIRGLPQRMGERRTRLAMPVLLLCASVLLALGPPGAPRAWDWGALAAAATLTVVSMLAPRHLTFPATVAVAAVDVALLVAHADALTNTS